MSAANRLPHWQSNRLWRLPLLTGKRLTSRNVWWRPNMLFFWTVRLTSGYWWVTVCPRMKQTPISLIKALHLKIPLLKKKFTTSISSSSILTMRLSKSTMIIFSLRKIKLRSLRSVNSNAKKISETIWITFTEMTIWLFATWRWILRRNQSTCVWSFLCWIAWQKNTSSLTSES